MPFAVPFGLSGWMHFRFRKLAGYDKFALAGHCWGNRAYQILCKFTHKATRILPSLLHNQYIKVVLKTEGEGGALNKATE